MCWPAVWTVRSVQPKERLVRTPRTDPTGSAAPCPVRDSDTAERLGGRQALTEDHLEKGRCVETCWEAQIFQGPSGQKAQAWLGSPDGGVVGRQIPAR